MFWKTKRQPEPKRDRLGAFCAIVSEAIDNATGAGSDCGTKVCVAAALEDFARAVRMHIATTRPL